MYREEKVIDGVLHWRSQPDGQWYKYTLESLTEKVILIQKELVLANSILRNI